MELLKVEAMGELLDFWMVDKMVDKKVWQQD
jgi:hypothetical protein